MNCSVLHVVASMHPRYGGPSRTVGRLVEALGVEGSTSVRLMTQRMQDEPLLAVNIEDELALTGETRSRISERLGLPVRRLLDEIQDTPNLVHSHGVWLPTNHWAANYAASQALPLLVHPRGMLEPWALGFHPIRKRVALKMFQQRDLARVALFFATSLQEAQSIRRFGLNQPIAVIPNGVDPPTTTSSVEQYKTERQMVLMSRLHPIKGVPMFLSAWSKVNPGGWKLVIAGPDEDGYRKKIEKEIDRLSLRGSVECIGDVSGSAKSRLLAGADLFVLPSFSENFGVVVAEALSYGLPVLTTTGTPWEILRDRDCGWWVVPEVEPLSAALREAIALDSDRLIGMQDRARALASEYSWSRIAADTAQIYRWVLGSGEKPGCVYEG
jgi:glycosyltransferase involved in cell wall biosynthesis